MNVWEDRGGYVTGDIHNRDSGVGAPFRSHGCCCRQMMGRRSYAGVAAHSFRAGEALTNFEWAADVRELAGGPVVAYNNNRDFPFSCADNNRRWASLHLQACQFFQRIQEDYALGASVLKPSSSSYLH